MGKTPGGKVCLHCRQWKPTAGFYRHATASDGYRNVCKKCFKAQAMATYHRIKGTETLAARRRRADANTRKRHPERVAARTAVGNAIKAGKLVPGRCAKCGTTENIQAHHHDYSKPLDVQWLCRKHHQHSPNP